MSIESIPLVGELASLGAAMSWAISLSLYTYFGKTISAQALNLFKNTFALICLLTVTPFIAESFPTDPFVIFLLTVSGVVGLAVGDTALFASLKRIGAQLTTTSQCLSPVFATLIAFITLDEVLSLKELAGVAVTAIAVGWTVYFSRTGAAYVADLPRQTVISGLAFALLSALAQAVAVVTAREALQSVHVVHGTMIRIFPAALILVLFVKFSLPSKIKVQNLWDVPNVKYLFLASFIGTFIGLMLMSGGAKYAKAGVAAALTSTFPIWIMPIARFYLGEHVNLKAAIGSVFAVGGIVLMLV